MGTWRHTVRKVGIRSALFLSYLFVGAGIFLGIESLDDGAREKRKYEERAKIMKNHNINESTMTEVENHYKEFEKYLRYYGEAKNGKWNFVNAFFFCGNVMTTIGMYLCSLLRVDCKMFLIYFYAFYVGSNTIGPKWIKKYIS